MNQYPPGFVPMMMPQPYMVAVRLPPGIPHPQRGQATAATAATFLPGMPLAAASRFPTPPPGSIPGAMPALTTAQTTPGISPTPQMLQLDPNSLKLAYSAEGARASALSAYGLGEIQLEQPVEKPIVKLDTYNSDLNLVIDEDGYGAYPMTEPSGFCFTWAGARSNHGVYKGKVYYEIQITEHLETDFGDDHQETDPHVMRVGWSSDDTTFQLGEEPESYGFGGTGKFSKENKFSNYGERFGHGDIIGALLDMDSRPPTLSYMKNGAWLGIACSLQGFPAGTKEKALFPHLLTKNSRFRINFGQEGTWYPPPPGYVYMQQAQDLVVGSQAPEKKSDCEMIMIIGLPGAGKTTWGINMRKTHPQKKYNVIGTDTLIDKMRVMGLPRKNNYHGRWEVLIDKATKCLNKLFDLAKTRNRNYILDQTNVYASARKRKMKNFQGFFRRAAVIQPDDQELIRRSEKRTEEGKFVPESAVLEMKANFRLPEDNDPLFDNIEYIELGKKDIQALLDRYNREGQQQTGPPRRFGQNKPFQPPPDLRQVASYSNQSSNPPLPPNQFGNQFQQSQATYGQPKPQEFGQLGRQDDQRYDSLTRQGRHPAPPGNRETEPASKRGRFDASSGGNSSALDLLKQEYAEEEPSQPQLPSASFAQRQPPPPKPTIKQEPQWGRGDLAWSAQFGQPAAQALLQNFGFVGDNSALLQQMPPNLAGGQFGQAVDYGAQAMNRGPGQQFNQPAAALSQPPPPPPEQPNISRGWQGAVFNTPPGIKQAADSRNQQNVSSQMEPSRNQNQWQQSPGFSDRPQGFQGNQQNQNQRQMQQPGGYGSQAQGFGNQGGRPGQQFGSLQNQQDQFRRQDQDSFRQQSNSEQGSSAGGYGNQQSNFRNQSFDKRPSGNQTKQNPNSFERNRFGRNFDSGDNANPNQMQQQKFGGAGFGNFPDHPPPLLDFKHHQSPEKPKRERRRPSKWDTPSESSPSPTPTPAESGVSEEVMAKVAAIQQNLQQHIEEQQQQEQQQQSNIPNEGSSSLGSSGWQQQEQDPKQDQTGPRMGNRWGGQDRGGQDRGGPDRGGQDHDRPHGRPGGFGGNEGQNNMNFQRGGFGGWSPRPMMGGRGGNSGQRMPFRPPMDQQRFQGERQRFGGPSGDQGFGGPQGGPHGGPHGGQRFGGPSGGQNHGRGGPRQFHSRGPGDQGGMRGGRPFGGRGGPFGQRGMHRGGPRGGPGGRWPRPN